MMIDNTGPGLAELRSKIGTGEPVTFGSGIGTMKMTVELLCAVGHYNLPILLPKAPMREDSVMVVAGSDAQSDSDARYLAIASFTENGELLSVVMASTTDENDTTLCPEHSLFDAFRAAARAQLEPGK